MPLKWYCREDFSLGEINYMKETTPQKELILSVTLKKKREESGISVDELAEKTKISHYNIKQLELGHYDLLPNTVFLRGYVKSICKVLGLEEKELLEELEQEVEGFEEKLIKGSNNEILSPLGSKEKRSINHRPSVWLVFLNYRYSYHIMVVAILLGVFLLYKYLPKQPTHSTLSEESSFSSVTTPEGSVVEPPVSIEEQHQEVFSSTTAPSLEASSKELVEALSSIKLTISAPLKINIIVDQEVEEARSFLEGEYTLNFDEKISLWVEDISKVKIDYSGKELSYPNENGQKRRIVFYGKTSEQISSEKKNEKL